MYQGKFAAKDKKSGQRSANLPRRQETPQELREEPGMQERPLTPTRPMPPQGRPMPPQGRPMPPQGRPMPPQGRPMRPQGRPMPPQGRPMPPQGRPMPSQGRPMPPQARPADPTRPMPLPPVEAEPKKRHYGGLIFYIIFFACILAIYTFTYFKLGDLQDWLVRYEAAQPTRKYEEVFNAYFADPNWGLLYDNAGIEESAFEGRDAFVAYMEEKVGDTPLTGLETSAGLSKDKKYIIRLGDEKIASFTLVDHNQATEVTDIPDWQLGEIQLFFEGEGTYYIRTLQGQMVQVNGIPLDETAVVRVSTTKAGEYLPEGVYPPLTATHQVNGLMVKPSVTVLDVSGQSVETVYEEETHTFAVPSIGGSSMDEDLRTLMLDAIKTYARYMSVKGGMENDLAKYFKRGTDLWKTFTSMERTWNQSYSKSYFSDENVKDYVRYNDTLFSARVSVNLHLVRKDGTEKVTTLDQSMFFVNESGKWKCYDMTAVDVSAGVEKVRLTFKNGDQVLKSDLIDTSVREVECPAVTAPEGKTFGGWMVEERKPNGDRVMHLTLVPGETGTAPVPAEGLKPMVLLPLFE